MKTAARRRCHYYSAQNLACDNFLLVADVMPEPNSTTQLLTKAGMANRATGSRPNIASIKRIGKRTRRQEHSGKDMLKG